MKVPGITGPPPAQPIKDQALEGSQFGRRALIAFLLLAAAVLLLALRYFYLQVINYEEFATRSVSNQVRVVPVPPNRGTIYDRRGRPVDGLTADSFTVLEDGAEQELRRLDRITDLPINAGIVLDTSTSMLEELGDAGVAAAMVRPVSLFPFPYAAIREAADFIENRLGEVFENPATRAQREAIENYVRSQAEKGWRLLPDGARPACQRIVARSSSIGSPMWSSRLRLRFCPAWRISSLVW